MGCGLSVVSCQSSADIGGGQPSVVVGHCQSLSIVISRCGSVVSHWLWSSDMVSSWLWLVVTSCRGLSVVSCQSVISCGLWSWSAVGCQLSVVVSHDQLSVVGCGRGQLCSCGCLSVIVGRCQPSVMVFSCGQSSLVVGCLSSSVSDLSVIISDHQ